MGAIDGAEIGGAGKGRREGAFRALLAFHAEVSRKAATIAERHRERLRCARGCSDCCLDGITVFEVEAERIRRLAPEVLKETPHPAGRCAFLDPEGGCRVYEHRPYVCRTQGLPLRWYGRREEGPSLVELRSICPLNEPGTPIEDLPAADCWEIGPGEGRLASIQTAFGGRAARVALRALFTPRP